jgi:hypothetical protein
MTATDHAGSPFDAVPEELIVLPQWVVFKLSPRSDNSGKFDKKPYDSRHGEAASGTDPSTWGAFDEAVAASRWFDGIGFTFSEDDPYAGVDFDGCRDKDSGAIAPWAQEFIDQLASYTEVSPSGTGVHILVRATIPPGHKQHYKGCLVEIYDRGRFFTVTGNHLPGTPLALNEATAAVQQIHDIVWSDGHYKEDGPLPSADGRYDEPRYGATGLPAEEVLQRCRNDRSGEQFIAFYDDADLSDVDDDDSRADWFVWSKLCFYCGNDVERIIALAEGGEQYRHSEDGAKAQERKEKWQRPDAAYETHQRATIAKILANHNKDSIFGRGLVSLDVGIPVSELVDQTWKALAEANDPALGNAPALYSRGGAVVRVHLDEGWRPSVQPITEAGLKVELDRIIRFMEWQGSGNGRHQVRVRPPMEVVKAVLAATYANLPALAGIIEAPVMRPNGSVLMTPGYDAATGLVYHPRVGDPPILPVPDKPTDRQVRAAFRLLHEVICDFPFHSPAPTR